MKRRTFVTASAAALAAPAFAQERPYTIVIPYAQGGSLDVAARLLVDQLTRVMGRTFILDFRPGANGLIGMRYAQQAQPDGHTLVFNSANYTLLPMTQKDAAYDPLKSFTPIACFGKTEYFLVAGVTVPGKTLRELIEFARSRPEGIFAGNAGAGSIGHMMCAAFGKAADIKVTHVPYKGGAEIIRALASGEVHMQLTTTTATVEALAQAGKLHYVAVASEKRSTLAPSVPTIRETLPRMLALDSWSALFGPAGLPADFVRRLSDAVGEAMAAPGVKEKLALQFIGPMFVPAAQMPQLLAATSAAQQRLIADSNVLSS